MRYRDRLNVRLEVEAVQWTGDVISFVPKVPGARWTEGRMVVRGKAIIRGWYAVMTYRPEGGAPLIQLMAPAIFEATYAPIPMGRSTLGLTRRTAP